jgi:hypothetical protein
MLPFNLGDSIHIEITVRHRGVEMSKDWVKNYMEKRWQARGEKSDQSEKLRMAQAGAGGLFKLFADQVKQDVNEYHDLGGDAELRYEKPWDLQFRVFKSVYPSVDLRVSLEGARIVCKYLFRESADDRHKEDNVYVRIVSNEMGNVQFYKNGDAYSEESEVSEVILAPVFQYLDTAR